MLPKSMKLIVGFIATGLMVTFILGLANSWKHP